MADLLDIPEEETSPAKSKMYQMYPEGRIPVSKSCGTVWKSRYTSAQKKRETSKIDQAWKEAVSYYQNDQVASKDRVQAVGPNARMLSSRIIEGYAETENLIWANTVAATSAIYSKNPECEISSDNVDLEQMIQMSEELVNSLFTKKETPGVWLKPKARRAITSAFLCNLGWLEVGWVHKEDSSEEAIAQLVELGEKLAKAKDSKEIKKIEGQLMALEDKVSMLSESGPFIKWRPAQHVLRDTQSVEEDLSDANWIMITDFESTSFLKAKYYIEGRDGDKSIFQPTHVVPSGSSDDLQERVSTFSIFESDKNHTELGFDDQEQYDAAKLTQVVYVWDKVTRRVYLFNSKHWKWPIWVWDDPYSLTTFFPVVPFYFYTSPTGGESKGEASYYLDQQDALNYCNSIINSARAWAGTKIAYDQNRVKPDEVQKLLFSNKREAIPIDVPDGLKLSDVMPQGVEHPALKFTQLFEKGPIYQAIDRMSVVSDVQRGAQFKTNTTNDAIAQYQQASATKYDMLLDQVEDAIGQTGYLLLQMCWRYMSAEQVVGVLGEKGAGWRNLTDEEIKSIAVRVEGGSTQKPNSMGKKKEALEIGQVLGQFARVTPVAAIVALKVMERAFDEVVINPEDWQAIGQSLAPPPGPEGGEGDAPPGEGPPNGGGGNGAIPPEAEQAMQQMIEQGVPPEQAAMKVKEALNGGGNGQG